MIIMPIVSDKQDRSETQEKTEISMASPYLNRRLVLRQSRFDIGVIRLDLVSSICYNIYKVLIGGTYRRQLDTVLVIFINVRK